MEWRTLKKILMKSDLYEAARCDIHLFWTLVKSRRNTRSNTINELVINGIIRRHPEEISNAFSNYYSETFKLKRGQIDNDFLTKLDSDVSSFLQSEDFTHDPTMTEFVKHGEKEVNNKIRLPQKLTEAGGLWSSEQDIKMDEERMSESKFKESIITQLQFRKQV
ncbi:hypothetical protein ACF0H5_010016 [Mactra antiquata]